MLLNLLLLSVPFSATVKIAECIGIYYTVSRLLPLQVQWFVGLKFGFADASVQHNACETRARVCCCIQLFNKTRLYLDCVV